MDHQAIELLARERIQGFAREAAGSRLARGDQPYDRARSLRTAGVEIGRLFALVAARAGTLLATARARVARAG